MSQKEIEIKMQQAELAIKMKNLKSEMDDQHEKIISEVSSKHIIELEELKAAYV